MSTDETTTQAPTSNTRDPWTCAGCGNLLTDDEHGNRRVTHCDRCTGLRTDETTTLPPDRLPMPEGFISPRGTLAEAANGNIFFITGFVASKLREAGNAPEVVAEFYARIKASTDYDMALRVAMAFVGEDEHGADLRNTARRTSRRDHAIQAMVDALGAIVYAGISLSAPEEEKRLYRAAEAALYEWRTCEDPAGEE